MGISLLVIAALTGCSTSKNTFPNRAYHNVTCKYNVYWNGNQAMKEAEKAYAKLSKDNFTATLPIYNYPDKSELGPCLSHLDRTIEKSSKAIHKHSMMIKGKEYVKTIDDAYFLMAKSYFYKQLHRAHLPEVEHPQRSGGSACPYPNAARLLFQRR